MTCPSRKPDLAHLLGLGLVAGFALFHGLSHAVEMPETASTILYAIGFISTSAGFASRRHRIRLYAA